MTTALPGAAAPPVPLDQHQIPAAQAGPGPVVIAGGAGSGKTQTLAARINYLLQTGHNPATISCVTTASRNGDHLRELVESYVSEPEAVRNILICTYHSMASTLLRTTGAAAHLGISPHFSIWDTDQSVEVIQSLIDHEPDQLKVPNNEIKDIVAWDGLNKARWKINSSIPPKQPHWIDILREYNNEKKRQNVLDLNDLITLAVEALETAPNIRDVWRAVRTRNLLADDFHDLSPIQYRLLQLITGNDKSITITFDPNQSVYSWRGSDPRLINKFKMDYPSHRQFVLRNNHRQTAALHESLRSLLEDDDLEGLTPSHQQPTRPEMGAPPAGVAYTGDQAGMNNHLFDLIEADVRSGLYNWGEIAILYRRKRLGSNFITGLVSRNIPYTILGENDGPDKGITRRTVALLTLALNPWDTATFSAAATVESDDNHKGLNRNATAAIARISREENINLIRAAEQYLPSLTQGVRTYKNLQYIIGAYAAVTDLLDNPETQLHQLCTDTEELSRASRAQRYSAATPADSQASKLLTMSRNSHRQPGETLREHLARFLESLKNSSYPELQSTENTDPYAHNSGLIIGSMHASKGAQWKSVYIVNTTDAIMPGNVDRLPTQERLHEEQRLFYAASSRASHKLTYIFSTDDSHGGTNQRSRFFDALDNIMTWTHPHQEPTP